MGDYFQAPARVVNVYVRGRVPELFTLSTRNSVATVTVSSFVAFLKGMNWKKSNV